MGLLRHFEKTETYKQKPKANKTKPKTKPHQMEAYLRRQPFNHWKVCVCETHNLTEVHEKLNLFKNT